MFFLTYDTAFLFLTLEPLLSQEIDEPLLEEVCLQQSHLTRTNQSVIGESKVKEVSGQKELKWTPKLTAC